MNDATENRHASGRLLDRRVMRLTRLQKALVDYVGDQGGDHVYISRCTAPSPDSVLCGYSWEGVHLSLRSLVRRGLLRKSGKNDGFYSLPHNAAPEPPANR